MPTIGRMFVIPVFRIFDVAKAREFYLDYLGWTCDWTHGEGQEVPQYLQISRNSRTIHLTEHVGDATPGSHVRMSWSDVDLYLGELRSRRYRYLNPGIERPPWGGRELRVIDPFGNRITFHTPDEPKPAA